MPSGVYERKIKPNWCRKEISWVEQPCIYPELGNCHICTSHSAQRGYPRMTIDNKHVFVSRVVWEKNYGEIPKGMLICHKCDTPGCINPKHLFLGTNADNMADMKKKKRKQGIQAGINHPQAKLTESQVKEIFFDNRTHTEIARDYAVTRCTIQKIKIGKQWGSVTKNFRREDA